MDTVSTIRKATTNDLDALKEVIETSGLFPPEYLDGMMENYLSGTSPEEVWLTKEVEGRPVAIAYFAPEKLTDGTYNLYLIAVHARLRGQGIGAEMMDYIEEHLRSNGKRVLIVETSGLPSFERTRKFYDQCRYKRMAVIEDFYNEGEDKVVFWKKLNAAQNV